jgi:hypothetical protein
VRSAGQPDSDNSYDTGAAAVAAASGGTVCARRERLPADFSQVVARLHDPRARFQLVICAQSPRHNAPYPSFEIVLPSLVDRAGELDRVIAEYAHDAFARIGVVRHRLAADDHEWVRRHASWSLAVLEKATARLAALRVFADLDIAAARLGMSRSLLEQWIKRRKVPMGSRVPVARARLRTHRDFDSRL